MLVDGHIYGSSWLSNSNGNWVCLDWKTGKPRYDTHWENKGTVIYADGMLYCYVEKTGSVARVKAQPAGFSPVSTFKITQGEKQHWAHMAIANGRLYVRHGSKLMAYAIK